MPMTPPPNQPPKVPRPTPVPRVSSPLISRLVERYAGELHRLQGQLDDLAATGLPFVEAGQDGRSTVTFLYRQRQALDSVLLFANRLTDETQLAQTLLDPIEGTDYWFAAFEMEDDWRASYCFIPTPAGARPSWQDAAGHNRLRAALDAGEADSYNARVCPNRGGNLLSVVELGSAPSSAYPLSHQKVEQVSWVETGEELPAYSLLRVGEPGPQAPLVLIFDGEVWAEQGLPAALRRAVAAGALADLNLVLIHSGGREQRWQELGANSPLVGTLAGPLMDRLRQEHGLSPRPERTLLAGQSLGAMSSLIGALSYPEVFGLALAQSASLWDPTAQQILEEVGQGELSPAHRQLELVLECGRQEWVLLEPNQHFFRSARELGFEARLEVFNGGHDYACWRASLPERLIEFFPAYPA